MFVFLVVAYAVFFHFMCQDLPQHGYDFIWVTFQTNNMGQAVSLDFLPAERPG